MAPKDNHSASVDDRKPDGAAQVPPRSSSPSPIPLPTKQEREGYYRRFPLLARTGTDVWDPLGPDGSPQAKLAEWCSQDHFGGPGQFSIIRSEMMTTLNTLGVSWTSVEATRTGYEDEWGLQWGKSIIVLIGVRPGTLTDEDGLSLPAAGKAAYACKQVLEKHEILDTHCEVAEFVVTHWPNFSEEPPTEKKLSKRQKRIAKRGK